MSAKVKPLNFPLAAKPSSAPWKVAQGSTTGKVFVARITYKLNGVKYPTPYASITLPLLGVMLKVAQPIGQRKQDLIEYAKFILETYKE